MAASLVGQNVTPTATTAVVNPTAGPNSSGTATTDGSLGSLLTSALTASAGVYGSQNAAQAQQQADVAAMGTQQTAMGNISSYWQPQQTAGVGAVNALSAAQGLNGAAPDYSGFENMPGYQFAIQQGTQAAERAASAQGSAYTPNTAINVGNYVTGTAMQDYNTYIQQLLSTAGLGSTANQNLQGAQLQTSANISQLQQNTGQAQASGVTGSSNAVAGQIGNVLNSLLGTGGNNSGASSGGVLGSIASWLTGGSSAGSAVSGATTASPIDTSLLGTGNIDTSLFGGNTTATVDQGLLSGASGGATGTDLSSTAGINYGFGASSGLPNYNTDPSANNLTDFSSTADSSNP